jgi:hypothetical protein
VVSRRAQDLPVPVHLSLDECLVAKPDFVVTATPWGVTPSLVVRDINFQLLIGKNLLLTPGVYDIARSIEVRRPNTVVLGIGHATLTAVNGAIPLDVADVPGVVVAGVTIDAGLKESPVLLRVGKKNGWGWSSAANPTTLSDVYFRVGGPHVGKVDTALEVNSDAGLVPVPGG